MSEHRVVILRSGFGGLFAALAHWAISFLGRSRAERTITPGQLFNEQRR